MNTIDIHDTCVLYICYLFRSSAQHPAIEVAVAQKLIEMGCNIRATCKEEKTAAMHATINDTDKMGLQQKKQKILDMLQIREKAVDKTKSQVMIGFMWQVLQREEEREAERLESLARVREEEEEEDE